VPTRKTSEDGSLKLPASDHLTEEHRMFCHVTENWRGRPLTSREVVVQLIGATKTAAGLDSSSYQSGIKISDQKIQSINLYREKFHGKWNYEIRPFVGD